MSLTRRTFLGSAAVLAAPAILPAWRAPDDLDRIDAFFAGHFGCSTADLNGTRTVVVPHRVSCSQGVVVFRHAASCIISVPHTVPEIERSMLRAAEPEEASDVRFLTKIFPVGADRVYGPSEIAFADRRFFTSGSSRARRLGVEDAPRLSRLFDWPQLAPYRCRLPLFGLFEGGDLVAAAGYCVVGKEVAVVDVRSHPEHPEEGLKREVVRAAVNHAFDQGLIPAWGKSSTPGFRPYGVTRGVEIYEIEF